MGLDQKQITQVWEGRIQSEIYALYFGDLASRYSARKQAITFFSFLSSSAAVVTLLSSLPSWAPITLSLCVAVLTAYSVAANLESKVRTMSKLQYSWLQISGEYDRLWSHTYMPEAQEDLYGLARRQQELSQLASTDAPNDQKSLGRWQDQVFKMHRLTNA